MSAQNRDLAWLDTWSQYLTQAPFAEQLPVQAMSLMQQVMAAILQGDSYISVSAAQVADLKALVAPPGEIAPFIYANEQLYLYRYWQLEQQVATHIQRLQQQDIQPIDATLYLDLLDDLYQKQALAMVAQRGLNLITGGPGTGKTYTLARIIAMLYQSIPNIRIAMAAPTGKAAQRMKEALQLSFADPKLSTLLTAELKHLNPITLHRLLGLGMQQQPKFNAQQPLPYDVIVVDEASMLDLNLAHMLFSAVANGTRLILLGDAHQLASVDVGSVLADLQATPILAEHRVHLHNSRRFKQGALIGEVAGWIQKQHHVETALTAFEKLLPATQLQPVQMTQDMSDVVQVEYLPEQLKAQDYDVYYEKLMWGFETYIEALKAYCSADEPEELLSDVVRSFDCYRILTAIRHGALGLRQLNQHIEQRVLTALALYTAKQGDWYVGRPVMMTYNDYQLGLSNGDIGICLQRLYEGQWQFDVYFPSLEKWFPAARLPRNIETAFSLTIHKSQGSEFEHVAVVLDHFAQNLLSKELIYTAITRAKKAVSILAAPQSLAQAVAVATTRKSGLLEKINKCDELLICVE